MVELIREQRGKISMIGGEMGPGLWAPRHAPQPGGVPVDLAPNVHQTHSVSQDELDKEEKEQIRVRKEDLATHVAHIKLPSTEHMMQLLEAEKTSIKATIEQREKLIESYRREADERVEDRNHLHWSQNPELQLARYRERVAQVHEEVLQDLRKEIEAERKLCAVLQNRLIELEREETSRKISSFKQDEFLDAVARWKTMQTVDLVRGQADVKIKSEDNKRTVEKKTMLRVKKDLEKRLEAQTKLLYDTQRKQFGTAFDSPVLHSWEWKAQKEIDRLLAEQEKLQDNRMKPLLNQQSTLLAAVTELELRIDEDRYDHKCRVEDLHTEEMQDDRMQRLSQKIRAIDVSDRGGRLSKLATIENRVAAMESKFDQLRQQHDQESKIVKQQFAKLNLEVEESNEYAAVNYNVERLVDAVGVVAQRVDFLSENNRQSDQRVLKLLDEKCRAVKNELSKERKQRGECVDDLCQAIKDSYPRLEELINEEASRRGESDETILKKLNQEVGELELELSKEKAAKEENEKVIFDIIKDTVEKVKRELETEKKERETSEQTLMRLLEDAMQKLNGIVHG